MSDNNRSRFKVKIPKLNVSSKTYDFSLSLPGMISAVGAGVLALTFFFVMGILIGRGYRPETDVPPLGDMMPTKQHGLVGQKPLKPKVLRAEELGYPERLKADPDMIMDKQPVAESKKSKTKVEKVKPADSGPEKPEVFEPTPAKPGESVFDYVYQVASFRQSEMAEALSDKLVAAGLRTSIESGKAKGSTWYRVQILHHGTPASTAGMKAVLATQGLGKPLLKKKTATQ
jgi:hypothetical protein